MKTDDLIGLLAADTAPVPRHAAERRFAIALAAGLLLSWAWVATEYGVRADLAQVAMTSAFAVKLVVPLLMAVCGVVVAFRLGHPGARVHAWPLGLAAPLLLWWGLAAVALTHADPDARPALVWGSTWRVCTFNVVVTALPIGAALLWALKGLAPTRPAWTGAAAGWLAGSAGAAVYALHCPEMATPFLGLWYVLGIAASAALGAVAGRLTLRW